MNARFLNTLRNFITGILSTAVGIIIPFIARTYIIYYMGEEYLGVNGLFTSIFYVINFANLGFSTAIASFLYKPLYEGDVTEANKLLNLLNSINHIIGTFVLIMGVFCFFNLNLFITGDVPNGVNVYLLFTIYLADTLMSYFFKSYVPILLNALQRADVWNSSNLIGRLIFGFLQLLIIFYIRKIELYVLMTNFVTICNRIYCCVFIKKHYPQYICEGKVSKSVKNKVLKDSLAMGMQKIGNLLSTSLDNIVIARYLDLTTVARYGNYNYILQAIGMILHTLNSSIIGSIGMGIVSKKSKDSVEEFWILDILYLSLISISCIIFFVCIQNFIYLWIGDKQISNLCVVLITLNFFFTQSKGVVSLYKDVKGIWWKDRYRPIVGGIINFTINIILVRCVGLSGVIFSTLFAVACIELPWEINVLFSNDDKTYIGIYFKYLFKFLLIILLAITSTLLITFHLKYNLFFLILRAIISFVLSIFLIYIFNKNDSNFSTLLNFVSKQLALIFKRIRL